MNLDISPLYYGYPANNSQLIVAIGALSRKYFVAHSSQLWAIFSVNVFVMF